MSPEGEIKSFEKMTEDEKKKAVGVPAEKLLELQCMTREQRKKWYRDQEKLTPKTT